MSPAPIPRGSSGLLSLGPTWRIRSENKRRKWDTGRFPGSPLPSVLQINNPRLQRPPPRSSPLLNRRLHGLPARPASGQRPRPRDPPPASGRGCGPGRGLLFCYGKSESPRGVGWRAGKAGGGDLKPLRYSDWSSRRKGAWPLLTMRCKDPTTFQSPRPRPRATPRLLGCRLLVLSATPPSQLLKMPLQRFGVPVWGPGVYASVPYSRRLNGSALRNLGKWRSQSWVRVNYGISCLEPSALYKTIANKSGKECEGDGTRTPECKKWN